MLTLFISGMLSEAHATTGEGDRNSRQQQENPNRGQNTEPSSLEDFSEDVNEGSVKIETARPIVKSSKPVPEQSKSVTEKPSRPAAESSYYESSYIDQEASSTGEDQNAVLSFNVIQYMFQRFKFSEEAY